MGRAIASTPRRSEMAALLCGQLCCQEGAFHVRAGRHEYGPGEHRPVPVPASPVDWELVVIWLRDRNIDEFEVLLQLSHHPGTSRAAPCARERLRWGPPVLRRPVDGQLVTE